MTFLQNLWRDLVDKRLWPVAVVLLLAAVSVPLLIDTGSSATPEAAVPANPTTTTTDPLSGGQVAVAVTTTDAPTTRDGRSRDPFKPLVFAKAAKVAATAAAGVGASAGVTPPSPVKVPGTTAGIRPSNASTPTLTPSPTTMGGTTTTPTTPRRPVTPRITTTRRLLAYELSLQIGRHQAMKSHRGVKPITYLPSRKFPLVSLLGFTSGGTRAVFMVTDNVVVTGKDRRCIGSQDPCRLLELGRGESVVLARLRAGGQPPNHFRLIVHNIALKEQKRGGAARASAVRGAGASALEPSQWLEQVTRANG